MRIQTSEVVVKLAFALSIADVRAAGVGKVVKLTYKHGLRHCGAVFTLNKK